MLIIPAIDLRGGKCVRLTQGDYSREKIYEGEPGAIARQFRDEGAELIHVVDLDGAKVGEPVNLQALESIVNASDARIEFGGGVRSLQVAQRILNLGVARVILGSALLADTNMGREVLRELGERAVAGIDAREGKVAVSGWTETSDTEATSFAAALEAAGAKRFIVTDISRDGLLQGPNTNFLMSMARAVKGAVIASGGISEIEDLRKLVGLRLPNLEGVIVGKAIYERRFTVKEALEVLTVATLGA